MKKKSFCTLMVLLCILGAERMNAQTTIGAQTDPQTFSLLELSTAIKKGGLRLPQLTTAERNALALSANPAQAKGLVIYNTDNGCIEYWNHTKWVSLCTGQAEISFVEGDPTSPAFLAEGEDRGPFTPQEDPASAAKPPYTVTVMSGADYLHIEVVDETTGEFRIIMDENPSAFDRTAIIRVTNNTTQEYKEFLCTQSGAECPAGISPFSLSSNTTTICGDGDAAIAFIANPQQDVNYQWVLGRTLLKTGNYLEITTPGKYLVYAGVVGCESVPHQEITITKTGADDSYSAPVVTATNNGILCGGGNVILTASNLTEPVKWFHDGKLYTGTHSNPLTLSGAVSAGEWFAVQQNGTCASPMSNVVNLIDQTSGSVALDMPLATVNGASLLGSPVICKSGTLELRIVNSYPAGTVYEWFANGESIYLGTEPVTYYAVNPSTSSMVLSVQVSNNAGCPNTAVSTKVNVTLTASARTTINNGAASAAICGNAPAVLTASNTSAVAYEWFKDGVLIVGANLSTYSTIQTGSYTVRYKDASACWSLLSNAISVVQSAGIVLNWQSEPSATGIVSDQTSITALASPSADSYSWSSSNTAVATVSQIGTGNTAYINFLTTGTSIIKVEASNSCGMTSKQYDLTVVTGCTPISSVNITPNTTVTKNLDTSGSPVTSGDASTTFTATATNGTPATAFEWYVNGSIQGETSNTFVFATPVGSSGTYVVYAAAVNGCTASNTAKSQAVTVNVNKEAELDVSGNYRLVGKKCYDVALTDWGATNECFALADRNNDFTALTSDYTFNASTSFSDLTFEVTGADASVLIDNVIKVDIATCRVTFKSTAREAARETGKITALKFNLVAKFKNNGGVEKQVILSNISVQDCFCGCSVKTVDGGWLTFMCYNLGAASSVQKLAPAKQAAHTTPANNYGDLYQWGRAKDGHQTRTSEIVSGAAIAFNTNSQASASTHKGKFITTQAAPYDWHSPQKDNLWNFNTYPANNPCPTGWRVPTTAEFQSIVNGNTTSVGSIPAAGKNMTGSGNYWKWNSSGTPGWLVYPNNTGAGKPTLFLPAAGRRGCWNGLLIDVGEHSTYWSRNVISTGAYNLSLGSNAVSPGNHDDRGNGFSVRCVAE